MSYLMTALRGERPSTLPVWFMRQAGRSLPEYRQVRRGIGMLESCLIPELAAEITLQPVRRYSSDAAIFFSDIMVPLKLAGVRVKIEPLVGPVFDQPYADSTTISSLFKQRLEDVEAIQHAVRLVVDELGETPLLGFAGAPFTLAAYLVEGKPSRDHLGARQLMHADPGLWDALMTWCAEISRQFLTIQLNAGAVAVQLFDSWAGSLSRADYVKYVKPYSIQVIQGLNSPTIHFSTNSAHLLTEFNDLGCSAISVDYRTPLDEAVQKLGGRTVVQGNIDPAMLVAPWEVLAAHVREVVRRGSAAPAHIVNLGHGVPPTTDPQVLLRIVELVHAL